MHRSFGRSFGSAEYRPFSLRFGRSSGRSGRSGLIEKISICETAITLIVLTCRNSQHLASTSVWDLLPMPANVTSTQVVLNSADSPGITDRTKRIFVLAADTTYIGSNAVVGRLREAEGWLEQIATSSTSSYILGSSSDICGKRARVQCRRRHWHSDT